MDERDFFALFLIDCSTRLPETRFEARAIVDELYDTMVSDEDPSIAALQKGDYVYCLWCNGSPPRARGTDM